MNSRRHILRGSTKALGDAVVGVSHVVEGVHSAVLKSLATVAPVPAPVPAVTQLVYKAVRGIAQSVSAGADVALDLLHELAPELEKPDALLAPWQLNTLSALNAAFGDYFHEQNEALAIPMSVCQEGRPLPLEPQALAAQLATPSAHVVIFIHGLGMNDLLWQLPDGSSYGRQLAQDADCSVLWLRYNTGRHIFQNGQELADTLEKLVTAYPVPVESLTLIGHSMGGLVARSAGYYGELLSHRWLHCLRGVACLGSPHRGAVLENIGNWFSHLLSVTPYSMPLSMIGKRRSAGIKDLRHGSLRHEDWLDRDLDDIRRFTPQPVPLVTGTRYLLVASTISLSTQGALTDHIGDGLVTARSALNPYTDQAEIEGQVTRALIAGVGHMKLLNDAQVYDAILDWYRTIHEAREDLVGDHR